MDLRSPIILLSLKEKITHSSLEIFVICHFNAVDNLTHARSHTNHLILFVICLFNAVDNLTDARYLIQEIHLQLAFVHFGITLRNIETVSSYFRKILLQ